MSKEPLKKKISMIGHFGVGKTSLVRRFVEHVYEDTYLTTVGVNTHRKDVTVGGEPMMLMMWDLAGKDDLAPVKMSNFRGSAGYILVVDGCRASTWTTAVELHQNVTEQFGSLPFVLAINKVDLVDQWEIERSEIASRGWTTFETSAKSGVNVEEIFLDLAARMLAEDPGE